MADLDPFANATELLGALRAGRVTATELADVYYSPNRALRRGASTPWWSATSSGPPPGPDRGRGHRPR
jgi:hypothetical protein